MAGSCSFTLISPYMIGLFMQAIFELQNGTITQEEYTTRQETIISFVFTVNVVSAACEWIKAARYHGIAQSFAAKMRYDLYYCYAKKCQVKDAKTEIDTEHSTDKFNMRLINEDIQILQDNFEIYTPLIIRCRIIIFCCLGLMIYASWKLTLVTLSSVFLIMLYSVFTGKTNNKRNSLVKQLKIELNQLCSL